MKKKRVEKSLIILMSVSLIFSFSACSEKDTTNKTVEYIAMWNAGEPEALFLTDMATDFQKETGIEIKISWAGRDNLNKLRTRFLSKDVPDLIDQGFSELGALFQDEILLQPIDDLFPQKITDENVTLNDVLDQKILNIYSVDGKKYYFPLKIVTSGFFYDKNIFKKYGISPPKTWDEFISNGKKMKETNFPPLALDGTIAFYNSYYYYWAVQRIMGNGALHDAVADKTGDLFTSNPGYLEAAKLVARLSESQENFFQKGYNGSSWPAAQADWALNKSGSILVGSWIASETKKQQVETFEIGFYPFPLVENGVGKISDMEILPFGFAIPKDAKNPDGAKKFLTYLMKKEHQQKFVEMTDNFSPRKEIPYPKILEDIRPYMQNAKYHLVFDGVQQDYPEWMAQVFYSLDDRLIYGTISPEDFIKGLSEETRKYWANKQ